MFVVAWRKLGSIRIVESSALPWLLVTTRNLGRNALRARSAAVELDESRLPADRTRQERVEELTWVRQAVSRLGGMDQRVVHLCLVEGYSYAEAAEHLGLTALGDCQARRASACRIAYSREGRGMNRAPKDGVYLDATLAVIGQQVEERIDERTRRRLRRNRIGAGRSRSRR